MNRVTLVSVVAHGRSWTCRWSDGSRITMHAETPAQARLFAAFTLRDCRA